jgi:putative oxidoreductase
MIRRLIVTDDSIATSILRLVLGVVFFAHGAQKMLGWFGGFGLIVGFLTRIAAAGIGVNMLVAIMTVHRAFGFFMNWTGTQKGEGFEYHLLVLAIVVFLMIRGAGAFSVDRMLSVSVFSSATESRPAHQ